MKKLSFVFCSILALLVCAAVLSASGVHTASAHEAYVLPQPFFWNELSQPDNPYEIHALDSRSNLVLFFEITAAVIIVYGLNFFVRRTRFGGMLHRAPERLSFLGPIFVRAAIAAAFFYSALSWSFLGPELPLSHMPWPEFMRIILFAASGMIALGLATELAALAALILFTIGFWKFGLYLATYLNYLGEILVLLLFGMRKFSLDRLILGPLKRFPKFRAYETTILRIFYGAALAYAAITVKFLHPALTIQVINDWNLAQFHWLFPSDPLLITLGGGLAELAIGIFIILGLEMRLTVLISLFYITLSLLYFRELVWPHLMLYGVSFSLLVMPETFTLDHIFFDRGHPPAGARIPLWRRPFLAHTPRPAKQANRR